VNLDARSGTLLDHPTEELRQPHLRRSR
jgi:hypothetical protein